VIEDDGLKKKFARDGDGDTALHKAIRHAKKTVFFTLLDSIRRDGRLRVNADIQNGDGVKFPWGFNAGSVPKYARPCPVTLSCVTGAR
jgi:hypothetical protein